MYGINTIDKGNGITQRIWKNDSGHTVKEYLLDGELTHRREILGGGKNATTYFDDNGTAYLTKVRQTGDNSIRFGEDRLLPNTTIQKKNFTAVTDSYGRPIENKVTDLSLKAPGEARESMSSIKRDSSYEKPDHRGHLVPDNFGGPASRENIVAQIDEINQGKIAKVEGIARELKNQGNTVDYKVKTNYADAKSGRPSSFEIEITSNGKKYELPKELRKIYNTSEESLTKADKFKTTVKENIVSAKEKIKPANELGVKSGLVAAGLTFAVSTTENVTEFIDGKISAEDMVLDIAGDTAVAGGGGYGTAFISTTVSQAMSKSSSALISKVGGSCLPAAVVAFGVESYEDISNFAQGKIDGVELTYELGENAAGVAGGFAGGAIAGAVIGTSLGPVGTAAGTIIGGTIGCVVSTELYKTAVEYGSDCVEYLADNAQKMAGDVIDAIEENVPEMLEGAKDAFNDFAESINLPFSLG